MKIVDEITLRPIAYIKTDLPDKFGVPRQSGLADGLVGRIVFEKEFNDPEMIRGLTGFSHIWVLWGFSRNRKRDYTATVRPPRLGGNIRMGVFATRSPYRPNPIGLSSLKILGYEDGKNGNVIIKVAGVDMVDNTPIYDIKPYIPYADSHPDAKSGFSVSGEEAGIGVEIPNNFLNLIPEDKRKGLFQILKEDPRPAYIEDSDRVYKMTYAGFTVSFTVNNSTAKVVDIKAEGPLVKRNVYNLKRVIYVAEKKCESLSAGLGLFGIEFVCPAAEEFINKDASFWNKSLLLTDKEDIFIFAEKTGIPTAFICDENSIDGLKVPAHFVVSAPEELTPAYLEKIYCTQAKLPAVIAFSEDFVLREIKKSEIKDCVGLFKEGLPFFETEDSAEDLSAKLEAYIDNVYTFYEYAFWGLYKSGKLIGIAGFKEGSLPPEAGYAIIPEMRRKGFATKALLMLIDYAGEELLAKEIRLRIKKDNTPSVKVAEKCGFSIISENDGEYIFGNGAIKNGN
ncbi:MAG: tRNA (N6-threonylcarbamoyladenosine(37)-N6)-methyltransferase TrmO [Lachnospiraceae bacterium]|nr:tRNA (N6-threonylcarbamoyladenosine(37)-N6)-methyltransferase TrmO [Lachnospiraceae bacterium]